MAQTTPNLGLTVWNNLSDPYDSGQLVDNFVAIDIHDHGTNGGVKLNAATAIQANTITSNQIITNAITSDELQQSSSINTNRAVTTDHIRDNVVTRAKLSTVFGTTGGNGSPYFVSAGSSIPSGFVTGDEIYYESSLGGPIWHFRYDSTYKWRFLGGAPIIKSGAAATLSTSAYSALGTDCKISSLPAGTYGVSYGCTVNPTTSAAALFAYMAIGINGVAASTGSEIRIDVSNGAMYSNDTTSPYAADGVYYYADDSGRKNMSSSMVITVGAGQYVQPIYNRSITVNTDTDLYVNDRFISLTPITLT
jgi:hypothetical protein